MLLALAGAGFFLLNTQQKVEKIRSTQTLEEALALAQEENLAVLMNFTGPDWCTACQFLEGKIFPAASFIEAMGDKIVLHNLLFPRDPILRAAVSEEEHKRRERILNSYKISGLPTVVVADEKGLPYAIIVGPRPTAEEYVAVLQDAFAVRQKRDAAFAEAATKTGFERATALAAALELLPKVCRDKYPEVIQEIVALDPENKLGYKMALASAEVTALQLEEFHAFAQTFRGRFKPEELKEDIGRIHTYLAREDLIPEVRQNLYRLEGDCYAFLRQLDAMVTSYQKAIDAAPETRVAKKLANDIKQLRENQEKIRQEAERAKTQQSQPNVQ